MFIHICIYIFVYKYVYIYRNKCIKTINIISLTIRFFVGIKPFYFQHRRALFVNAPTR
jgi:hypothetical protein